VEWHGFTIDVIERVQPGFELYPKPTVDDVAHLERELGLRLPDSFKDFVAAFGAGDLGEFFKVYGVAPAGDSAALLTEAGRYRADFEQYGPRFNASEVERRLIPFASTYGGDMIGWDVSGASGGEYPIVGLPRDGAAVVPVAPTFPEFVGRVFTGAAMKALGYSDPSPCPKSFEPWCRPSRG
jgi:cell wall assembly regulator SMI1